MSNVTPLRDTVPPNEPVADVVETLERLLAEAKDGSLRAVGFATVWHDGTIKHGWEKEYGRGASLGFGLDLLSQRYLQTYLVKPE